MSRLFFSLWPQASVREQICAAASAYAQTGRTVTRERVHLTLRFLAEVPQENIAEIKHNAREIRCPQFTIELSILGFFKRPSIAWLGPAQAPAALSQLVAGVNCACENAGLNIEKQHYRPHVSLAHDARAPLAAKLHPPIIWPVREFSLCESLQSGQGPIYKNIGCWPLTPAGAV